MFVHVFMYGLYSTAEGLYIDNKWSLVKRFIDADI